MSTSKSFSIIRIGDHVSKRSCTPKIGLIWGNCQSAYVENNETGIKKSVCHSLLTHGPEIAH